jgi:hypothetical protein
LDGGTLLDDWMEQAKPVSRYTHVDNLPETSPY